MSDKDLMGTHMKEFERATATVLPVHTNTVIRVDGKAFHTFTRGLSTPFDDRFMDAMDATALYLCENISGAVLAFTQSDEISIVLADYSKPSTEPWMGGKVQKVTSIAASMATAAFNRAFADPDKMALFDARVFTLPHIADVQDYLIWRQKDTYRNAVSMVSSEFFSHNYLHGLGVNERLTLLHTGGVHLSDYPDKCFKGRITEPKFSTETITYTRKDTGEEITVKDVVRKQWVTHTAPDFWCMY